VVAVVVPGASVAHAANPAPTSPKPQCVYAENGTPGRGCLPGQQGGSVSGTFAAGGEFTVNTEAGGLAPCYTHVSTGCYYSLSDPSVSGCVYLANNDPTDVRQCGSLSTQGSVSFQRQGACSGSLGGTYVYGGPATDPSTYWVARAAKLAKCVFKVS